MRRDVEAQLDARIRGVDRLAPRPRGAAEPPPQLAFGDQDGACHPQRTVDPHPRTIGDGTGSAIVAHRHADDQIRDPARHEPERQAADDIERVVGAEVDPSERDQADDHPRRHAPPPPQVGRDRPRQPGRQDHVAGHERGAGRRRRSADDRVGLGDGGSFPEHELPDATLDQKLQHGDQRGRRGQAPPTQHERHDDDERPDREGAEVLDGVAHLLERRGDPVDRLEDRALHSPDAPVACEHRAGGEDEPAHHDRHRVDPPTLEPLGHRPSRAQDRAGTRYPANGAIEAGGPVCSNARASRSTAASSPRMPDDLQADRQSRRRAPARHGDRGPPEDRDAPARLHPVDVGRHGHPRDLGGVLDLDREGGDLRDRLDEDVEGLEERGGAAADIRSQRMRTRHVVARSARGRARCSRSPCP